MAQCNGKCREEDGAFVVFCCVSCCPVMSNDDESQMRAKVAIIAIVIAIAIVVVVTVTDAS